MNHLFRCLLLSILIILPSAAMAQEVFEDPDGKYSVNLPNGWLGIVSQDTVGRNDVIMVFRNRENGTLKIRSVEDADPATDIMEFAKEDENNTVRFRPKYVKLSLEKFLAGTGRTGALLSYDFNNAAGQPFMGRVYYLKVSEKTIYILTFIGRKNILGSLRNQTDAIARSLKVK
ncbi:MAG: hypothetical protein AB7H86_23170 [Blastocatellales bacterium]